MSNEVTIEETWNKHSIEQLISMNSRGKSAISLPEQQEFEATVYNSKSEEVKEGYSHKGKLKLDVKELDPGIYIIHIKKGKEIIKQKLAIEK